MNTMAWAGTNDNTKLGKFYFLPSLSSLKEDHASFAPFTDNSHVRVHIPAVFVQVSVFSPQFIIHMKWDIIFSKNEMNNLTKIGGLSFNNLKINQINTHVKEPTTRKSLRTFYPIPVPKHVIYIYKSILLDNSG